MKKYKIFILFLITLTFSFLVSIGFFKSTNFLLTDLLLSGGADNSQEVVIVGVDEASIEALGQIPWDKEVYEKFLSNLNESQAAIVGIDITFSEYVDSQEEMLYGAVKKYNNIILSSNAILTDNLDEHDTLIASGIHLPGDSAMLSRPTFGFTAYSIDDDNVYRKALPYVYDAESKYYRSSFSYKVYMNFCLKNDIEIIELPISYYKRPYIRFTSDSDSIETIPFYKVVEGDYPKNYFKDKIVLVGMMEQNGKDEHYTVDGRKYDVEIQANFINNLLTGDLHYDLFEEHRLYINNSLYMNLTMFFWVFINGLLYILMVISVENNDFKTVASFWIVVVYLIVQFTIFTEGYIIDFTVPIIMVVILSFVDTLLDFYDARVEKQKMTEIVSTYVPARVVDKIVNENHSTLSLGGEEREITVMFIDIRGFTSFTESISPSECVEVLNEYWTLVTDIIEKNGGLVDKYLGDGVMAIYNAPYDLRKHEYFCVRSAVEIIKETKIVNEEILEKYNVDLRMGIGINTGKAIVGNVGSINRMNYTAIGDTVNIASRLESTAGKSQILISERVFKSIEHKFVTKELGEKKFRGKENEILVYEVLDIL